ncbi:hypothetical protein EON81_17130 [bacterium]|nr:MAG: hypothetical protein EON81_17130 [bacterium]
MTRVRIDILLAADAPAAAILHRGPYGHTQILHWNLTTDEITAGQWITAKVHMRCCDLSPDGHHLVGLFSDNSAKRLEEAASKFELEDHFDAQAWTAVSVVPYFTAVALWFTGYSYRLTYGYGQGSGFIGGGVWRGRNRLEVNHPYAPKAAIQPPEDLEVESVFYFKRHELNWVWHERLRRSGWKQRNRNLKPEDSVWSMDRWEKTFAEGRLIYESRTTEDSGPERWFLFDLAGNLVREGKVPQFGIQFMEIDVRGRVIYADGSAVYAWERFPHGEPKIVADLSDNRFEPVPAPPGYRAKFEPRALSDSQVDPNDVTPSLWAEMDEAF